MDYKGKKMAFKEDGSDGEGDTPRREATGATAGARPLESVKWKKHIRSQLEQAPKGQLKASKLRKKVLAAVAAEVQMDASADALKEAFQKKLDSSSQFTVADGVVSLVRASAGLVH